MALFPRLAIAGILLTAAISPLVGPASPALAAPTAAALAQRWAPVHYQDTDNSDYDADYVSAVDFDGEWNTLDNWEAQGVSVARLTGTAYYSVVDTSTHWFVLYAFYHPRDWVDYPDPLGRDHHENDMEGLVLTVRKNGTPYGALEAMVTVAHSDFFSYTPAGSPFTNGRESIDGTVRMQTHNGTARPTTYQEAKGHGLKAWNGAAFPGGDGVVYYPTTGAAEAPTGGNDRSVPYRLVNSFAAAGLWSRRLDSQTFASYGTFRGDNGKDNAANAAWGWDDANDGSDLPRGMLATDPAYLVATYFGNEGTFSRTYLSNPYRG